MKEDECKQLMNELLDLSWISKSFRRDVTYWSFDGKKLSMPPWNEDCYVDEENWDNFEDFEKYGNAFVKATLKTPQ